MFHIHFVVEHAPESEKLVGGEDIHDAGAQGGVLLGNGYVVEEGHQSVWSLDFAGMAEELLHEPAGVDH